MFSEPCVLYFFTHYGLDRSVLRIALKRLTVTVLAVRISFESLFHVWQVQHGRYDHCVSRIQLRGLPMHHVCRPSCFGL